MYIFGCSSLPTVEADSRGISGLVAVSVMLFLLRAILTTFV